jgi:hypothetical protein
VGGGAAHAHGSSPPPLSRRRPPRSSLALDPCWPTNPALLWNLRVALCSIKNFLSSNSSAILGIGGLFVVTVSRGGGLRALRGKCFFRWDSQGGDVALPSMVPCGHCGPCGQVDVGAEPGLGVLIATVNNVSVASSWSEGPGSSYTLVYRVREGDGFVSGQPPRTVLQVYDVARPAGQSDVVDSSVDTWYFNSFSSFVVDATRPVITYAGIRNGTTATQGTCVSLKRCRGTLPPPPLHIAEPWLP